MHRSRAPSIAPDTFFVAQSWAGYTTNMSGFDLRQAQAQEDTGVPGASAAAQDTKRRGANIQASCNFGDGMAVEDDARDDVRAFANL
jgi:hypothetical protein